MRAESVEAMKSYAIAVQSNQDSAETATLDAQILSMRHSGSTVAEIADSLGLSNAEIEFSIRQAVRREREALESTPRSEILMGSVAFLRHARDLQMADVSALASAEFKVDKSGKIIKKKLKLGDRASLAVAKSRLIEKAVSFEKSVADLMIRTGVLPKQAEEIHVTMGSTKGSLSALDGDEEDIEVTREGDDVRNRAELLSDIRSHLVVSRRLKDSSIGVPDDAIVIDDDKETQEIS